MPQHVNFISKFRVEISVLWTLPSSSPFLIVFLILFPTCIWTALDLNLCSTRSLIISTHTRRRFRRSRLRLTFDEETKLRRTHNPRSLIFIVFPIPRSMFIWRIRILYRTIFQRRSISHSVPNKKSIERSAFPVEKWNKHAIVGEIKNATKNEQSVKVLTETLGVVSLNST